MKIILSLAPFLFLGCATGPRCGNPDAAKIVYVHKQSCEIRIRQVSIGSELKIPATLRRPDLASFQLEWMEPGLVNGKVVMGHFVFIPRSQMEEKR